MKVLTLTRLRNWAGTAPAKSDFPGVLRRLITCSVAVDQVQFPDGEGVWLPGRDGIVRCSVEHRDVPRGESVWELGTQKSDILGKAESDYAKHADLEKRNEIEFIFVTPHVWTGKTKWAREKNALGEWKHVRVYDATDVVRWIHDQPAVELWFLQSIGDLTPLSFMDPDSAWREWSKLSSPPTTEALVLAGRSEAADDLLQRLANSEIAPISSSSPGESYGFALAALRTIAKPKDRTDILARLIVAKNPAALAELSQTTNHIILVHSPTGPISPGSVGAGCRIIVPYGNAPESGREPIVLPRPTHRQFIEALKTMKIPETELESAARVSGLSVTVFQRRYTASVRTLPTWCTPQNKVLHAALLAGSWNKGHEPDREFLRQLSGCSTYQKFEDALIDFCTGDDPPAISAGSRWRMTSPVDCFGLVAQHISQELLETYRPLAISALTFADPNLILGQEQELLTQPIPGCSEWLREGIVEILLIISELGGESRFRRDAHEYVDSVVGGIPGMQSDWHRYGSLQQYLARLAEAAPRPFLTNLEHLLESHRDGQPHLFVSQDSFWGRHYHTGILWALETLAQFPQYLSQACRILGRCAALDKGIKILNRPVNSLSAIFLWWYPGTTAVAEDRLQALRTLAALFPDTAWTVCANSMPTGGHRTASLPPRPKWATLPDPPNVDRTRHALYLYGLGMMEIALSLCGNSPERCIKLIQCCPQIEPGRRPHFYTAIRTAANGMSSQQREEFYNELRDFVEGHRKHKAAKWALPEEQLQPLDDLVRDITPSDPVGRELWLFQEWHPNVGIPFTTVERMESAIAQARANALKAVFDHSGIDGIKQLVARAKYPGFIAHTVVGVVPDATLWQLFGDSSLPSPFSSQLSHVLYRQFPERWQIEVTALSQREPAFIATLLCGAPCAEGTWLLATTIGEVVSAEYWRQVADFPDGNDEHWENLARHLMGAGRSDTLVDLIALYKPTLDPRLLLEAADSLIGLLSTTTKKPQCDSHDVTEFIGLLRSSQEDRVEIAKREYALIPAMELDTFDGQTLLIHEFIAEDPQLFVSILEDMYIPESSTDEERAAVRSSRDELSNARGRIGYKIIESMTKLPGTKPNGEVDEQVLWTWIDGVLTLSASRDRKAVAEAHIGRLLAHSKDDPASHHWPNRTVESIIQRLSNDRVERSLIIERFNMRGVVSRDPSEGGAQERALAEECRRNAQKLLPGSTRMRAVLDRMAASWERDAESEDKETMEDMLDL